MAQIRSPASSAGRPKSSLRTRPKPRPAATKRKFYLMTSKAVSRASGYQLQNPPTAFPPLKQRGLSHYPKVPIFRADASRGRLHWDFEVLAGYWFISDR